MKNVNDKNLNSKTTKSSGEQYDQAFVNWAAACRRGGFPEETTNDNDIEQEAPLRQDLQSTSGQTKKDGLTIPNPYYYITKVMESQFLVRPLILSAILGAIAGPSMYVYDLHHEIPDNVGTSMEESAMAGHVETFSQLELTKLELDRVTAEFNFKSKLNEDVSKEQVAIDNLTSELETMADNAVLGLYLNGITDSEAAISEIDFEAQHSELMTFLDESELGNLNLATNIKAGALDECIAETDLSTLDNNVAEINQCMVDRSNASEEARSGIALTIPMLSFALYLHFFGFFGKSKSEEIPKRITLGGNKKRLPTNH